MRLSLDLKSLYCLISIFLGLVSASRTSFFPSKRCLLTRGGSTTTSTQELDQQILRDIDKNKNLQPLTNTITPSQLNEIYHKDLPQGEDAYRFLRGLASSKTFIQHYWHRRPLLLKRTQQQAGDKNNDWIPGIFQVDPDLKLIDDSYIAGYKTAEILRNGTKTDTWQFIPIKQDPTRPTLWKDVEEALKGGTIYFNTAGSLWPTLGALCRLTTAAFGFPTNVNVYVTPPGTTLSVPPHTDRQDVFCFQTQGSKRWKVYNPPVVSKDKDALNRGKGGDVLTKEELGEPVLDILLEPGDVLYVPTGFPHTTDTTTTAAPEGADSVSDTSVHLTMGLDTHVWGLTLAHLRWSLLQKSGKDFRMPNIHDDPARFWKSLESLPIGFLGGDSWIQHLQQDPTTSTSSPYREELMAKLKDLMIVLEPDRWNNDGESMPSDQEFQDVIDYMILQHLRTLLVTQETMFQNIQPKEPETLIKAFQGSKAQEKAMEDFGKFSNSEALRNVFAQRRKYQEERLRSVSNNDE